MTPELAKTFASFRPSSKTTRGADRYRERLREQGHRPSPSHAGEFLRIRPLVSQSRTNPPSPSGLKTISVFLRFAAKGSERDAGRRRADASRAAMKHRLMRSLRSAAETIMLLDNRRGARSLVSSKHVRQSARHANLANQTVRINSYLSSSRRRINSADCTSPLRRVQY